MMALTPGDLAAFGSLGFLAVTWTVGQVYMWRKAHTSSATSFALTDQRVTVISEEVTRLANLTESLNDKFNAHKGEFEFFRGENTAQHRGVVAELARLSAASEGLQRQLQLLMTGGAGKRLRITEEETG